MRREGRRGGKKGMRRRIRTGEIERERTRKGWSIGVMTTEHEQDEPEGGKDRVSRMIELMNFAALYDT